MIATTGMFLVLVAAAACVAAAVGCGMAAQARGGARPGGWLALAAAAVVWTLGNLAGVLQGGEEIEGWGPSAGSLAASGLGLAGLLRLHGAPTRVWASARTIVDGLIVGGSALFIAWTLGLEDSYLAADPDGRLTVARALADLVIASCAIVMVTRCRPQARPRLALVAVGFGAIALADSALVYETLGGSAAAMQLLYAGWAVGWTSIGLLSMQGRGEPERGHELEPGLPGQASVFVPSAPFAVALLAAAAAATRGDFDGVLIWTGVAVIVLIVLRQVLALLENISYWRRLEAKVEARTDDLRRSEARFRSLVTNSSDVITVVAPDGTIRYLSPSAHTVLGYEPGELSRVTATRLLHPDDAPRVMAAARELGAGRTETRTVEFRFRHKDGGWRYVEAIASDLRNDVAVGAFVINARDITERKALEEQLTHRAFHDPLTGLANRALFADRVGHALGRRGRGRDPIAVLFLDLDDFKNVNDSLGHGVGDDLLTAVANRLFNCVGPGDTVARLGGDEFAVLVEQMTDAFEGARVAERIIEALATPFEISGKQVFIRASIGISTSPPASDSVHELMRTADVAMYTAKAHGKGLYEVFEQSMHAVLIQRLELEADLRKALEDDQLELQYQPIVALKTGRIRSLEALVRWRHPELGLMLPDRFIQLAEETGLIVPIGRWVLRQACKQARRWQRDFRFNPAIRLAVNLSARQLQEPELIREVQDALDDSGLNPGLLMLEITESVLVEDNAHAVAKLGELRGLGVRVVVDDFGTGYSSLSYLRRLPIDILKVDRAFLDGMKPGSPEAALVEAIVAMSHSLGLASVAEGVERADQAAELTRMGCNLAQGFYFARPAPPRRITELLDAGAVLSSHVTEGSPSHAAPRRRSGFRPRPQPGL
jgi:diguanylate cyclase (GGDEF)-like protein/PAS domain S-box-containing protein